MCIRRRPSSGAAIAEISRAAPSFQVNIVPFAVRHCGSAMRTTPELPGLIAQFNNITCGCWAKTYRGSRI